MNGNTSISINKKPAFPAKGKTAFQTNGKQQFSQYFCNKVSKVKTILARKKK